MLVNCVPHDGQSCPTTGQIRPTSANIRPGPKGRIWPTSANVGRARTDVSRIWADAKCGQMWPNVGKIRPSMACSRPEIDQLRPKLARTRPPPTRIRPNPALFQTGPRSDEIVLDSVDIGSDLDRFRRVQNSTKSVQVWPTLVETETISGDTIRRDRSKLGRFQAKFSQTNHQPEFWPEKRACKARNWTTICFSGSHFGCGADCRTSKIGSSEPEERILEQIQAPSALVWAKSH